MRKLILLLALISTQSFSQSMSKWEITDNAKENILINSLKFTNRSRCALDSKLPSKSIFIMLDNIAVAKTVHRFATAVGLDENQEVNMAIERYRYTIIELIKVISDRIFSGDLPLLKENSSNLKGYSQLAKDCTDSNNCDNLYSLIENVWNTKNSNNDKFITRAFLNAKTSCFYLKKFSPLEAHLLSSKPSPSTLTSIGETMHKLDDYMTSCDDFSKQTSTKVANYQFEILNVEEKNWNYYGFDYWSSVKQYLSWAFRNSSLVEKMAFPYGNIIKNISIEESLIFLSNGCKSIESPDCTAKDLSMNTMRFFTQTTDQQAIFNHDMLKQLPDGPEFDVLSNPIMDVNNDVMNLSQFASADQWAENFRNNFTKARGFIKLKFLKSINSLSMILNTYSPEDLLKSLDNTVNKIKEGNVKENNIIKNELYYLCSEFKVAADDKLSFLKHDMNVLKELNSLKAITKAINKDEIKNYFGKYQDLAKKVNNYCNELAKTKLWEDEKFELKREGFHSWYHEYVFNKKAPFKTRTINELKDIFKPMVTFATYQDSKRKSNIICTEGANCSRLVLDSIIDLYAILQYSDSLLQISNEIKNPAMANPMAERYSCKVYDPWFQLKKSIGQFFQDISKAALMTFVPTPIYVDIAIKPNTPVAFNKLIKDGKVFFDPQYDSAKISGSLVADFGALLGVPCMVSISNTNNNPGKYYSFNGISINKCKENETNVLTVMGTEDVNNNSSNSSKCYSCAMNLESISGIVSKINPITRGAFFLAKGVYTLYQNLKDPQNIPRSWEVDVNNVYHTYRKYGHVNKFCARKLRGGNGCLSNKCESSIAKQVNKFLKGAITETNISKLRYNSFIKLDSCDEPIQIKTSLNRKRICNAENMFFEDFIVPESCSKIIKKEFK